jgi:chromosome segregation and condensation protein ScpB
MDKLEKNIEALLFVSGEGMAISKLAEILNKKDSEIEDSLGALKKHLEKEIVYFF